MKIKKNLAVLRYPGGKSRMLEVLHGIMEPWLAKADMFIEPFVGGGSMALSVADRYPDMRIWINDKDPNINSFWGLVAHGYRSEFEEMRALLLRGATLDIFDAERALAGGDLSRAHKAYHAIFFCKTTHNGIFGASPIGGRSQEGKWKIDCQYKPERIIEKIERVRALLRGRCVVYSTDAIDLLKNTASYPTYLDPPYFAAGKKCYQTWMLPEEHANLAEELKRRKNWLLSYDHCDEVYEMYSWANIGEWSTEYSMASHGKKASWKEKTELLIRAQS